MMITYSTTVWDSRNTTIITIISPHTNFRAKHEIEEQPKLILFNFQRLSTVANLHRLAKRSYPLMAIGSVIRIQAIYKSR